MAKEKKKRSLKRAHRTIAILILIFFVALLLGRLYFRLPVSDYYKASEKGFEIPGLNDGFVPQGLDYDGLGYFWTTGYMNDGTASPVYIVAKESGDLEKTLRLAKEDGSDYTGHAGGIAVTPDFVYIAEGEENCVYVYRSEDMVAAADGVSVKAVGRISTAASAEDYLEPACLYVSDGYLFVLEFYRDVDYPTPDSHKLTTPAGDYNQAMAVAYPLSEDAAFGVKEPPSFAISLPDHVQGMCFGDNSIYLSTSWGTSFSYIYEYSMGDLFGTAEEVRKSEITLLGTTMPLYYFDSGNLIGEYKLPPMAEEIVVVDGRLYTMCESASNKYIFGKLTSSEWCYATKLSDMAD